MLHRPVEYGMRELHIARIKIPEFKKREDALRHTVDIQRVDTVVEVLWSRVLTEKMSPIELETSSHTGVEF